MDVIVALEHRFWRTPDGIYWTATIFPHSFWSRYLSVFDQVHVLARACDGPAPRDSWLRVDGDQVSFAPIPAYVGPWQFVRDFGKVRAAVRSHLRAEAAVVIQVPGTVATTTFRCLQRGRPCGVEVVADPEVYFAKQSFQHPLRPFWRWWFTFNQEREIRQAACLLYVTERALQERYPPGKGEGKQSAQSSETGRFSVSACDVVMPDEAFCSPATADTDEVRAHCGVRFRILYVGSLEHTTKGPDILIRSFAQALSAGLDAELAMIGEGREKSRMERLAQSLGVGGRVKFLGFLRGADSVRRELDASDLFVLPTWSEGTPRALVEAMARGLPCISTCIVGIPELLPEVALVRPGDVAGLAAKILQFAKDPKLRLELGRQNFATARNYHESILQPKRVAFFESLRDATREWQKARAS